jgi:anthraniloyl-CoA monooxygenase
MRIEVIGGGPAGLYFAILMAKEGAATASGDAAGGGAHTITVHERNKADDTFGWGVVFSAETLSHFEDADAESYREITKNFRYWDNIDTFFGGQCITSTGHGFAGMSRKLLLNILQRRAAELGVKIAYQTEVPGAVLDDARFADADLIIAADGINSAVRAAYADVFQPATDWRKCRFTWLGTTLPLTAFTFIYRESEHGLFQVHAYPFADGLSTFIVECHEDVWKRAGLDQTDEAGTVAYCEKLFAADLKGHRLLTNRSLWRAFPTVTCKKWSHNNVVLMGDAVHTAHFSIGSGTKLAMEDAIALRDALRGAGLATGPKSAKPARDDVEGALQAYYDARWLDVAKLQRAAQVSLTFFENTKRYTHQDPVQFTFNQTTRSKRITWDNLTLRDPAYVGRVREWYAKSVGAKQSKDGSWPVPMFTPYAMRDMKLVNRCVVSPMCMYSADDGGVDDWHLVHVGSRAVGGAGLVICEGTGVSADGRISPGCAGMYRDGHVAAWKRIVDFVHARSKAKIGMQICHSGRKGSTKLPWEAGDTNLDSGNWELIAPSAIPYKAGNIVPREMNRADMDRVRDAFVSSATMADAAGFDLLELHYAHGYLMATFISPLTNRRADGYGGGIEGRMRYPLEVFDAVRRVWPERKPMSVRISASDWAEGGLSPSDAVEAARMLKDHGVDIIDVSAGQTVPQQQPVYGRMFQVPFSDQIRHEVGVATMTVGNIQGPDHINTILAAGRADLCVLARPHLKDPYLTLHAAEQYGYAEQYWPPQYLAVKPRAAKAGPPGAPASRREDVEE